MPYAPPAPWTVCTAAPGNARPATPRGDDNDLDPAGDVGGASPPAEVGVAPFLSSTPLEVRAAGGSPNGGGLEVAGEALEVPALGKGGVSDPGVGSGGDATAGGGGDVDAAGDAAEATGYPPGPPPTLGEKEPGCPDGAPTKPAVLMVGGAAPMGAWAGRGGTMLGACIKAPRAAFMLSAPPEDGSWCWCWCWP